MSGFSMHLLVRTHLAYSTAQPCDLLLQIEALSDAGQSCDAPQLTLDPQSTAHIIAGEEGLGTRRWISAGPQFECNYEAVIEVTRKAGALDGLRQTHWTGIPANVVKYLMPSRYCHSDAFLDFVAGTFGGLQGGAMVAAMSSWIAERFTYDNTASHAGTTASDSFASLSGVCRDYAHVLITFARAGGIPARFVSAYAPDVKPQDFHAVVEVYLEGSWHIVDPTGMAHPGETARICVGRDAADASFMTSYGRVELVSQSVEVRRVTR